MSMNDDLTAIQRCVDDLARAVGRIQPQLDGGLRRVRADTDHLRESVALLRATAAAETAPPPHREPRDDRHPVRQLPGWTDSDDEGSARGPARLTHTHASRFERRLPWPPARNPPVPNPIPRAAPASEAGPVPRSPRHLRTDRWWLAPATTAAGLFAFVVYSTWRAFANADYYAAPCVSPFYSPCLAENCEPMRHGPNWEIFGSWWGLSRCSS